MLGQISEAGIPNGGPWPAADNNGNLFPAETLEEPQTEEYTDKRIFYGVDVVFADAGSLGLQPGTVQFWAFHPWLRQPLPSDNDPFHGAFPGPLELTDTHMKVIRRPLLYELLKLRLLA